MKALIPPFLLILSACNSAPSSEAESENAIADRAADIRNQADADVSKQIQEIDAAANAEAADLAETPVNAQ